MGQGVFGIFPEKNKWTLDIVSPAGDKLMGRDSREGAAQML